MTLVILLPHVLAAGVTDSSRFFTDDYHLFPCLSLINFYIFISNRSCVSMVKQIDIISHALIIVMCFTLFPLTNLEHSRNLCKKYFEAIFEISTTCMPNNHPCQ